MSDEVGSPGGGSTVHPVDSPVEERLRCGIIMPIASMPDYPADHWATVQQMIARAIDGAGMSPEPVWLTGGSDVLHERIVLNLHDLPVAVCDVSGLNPNVMLELGLRLAFGKPTIIVTDERVRPPFDIGTIEYVPYAHSLHVLRMEDFVERLAEKLRVTVDCDHRGEYRPFIKTFGPIVPGTLGEEGVPIGRLVLDELAEMRSALRSMDQSQNEASRRLDAAGRVTISETNRIRFMLPKQELSSFLEAALSLSGVGGAEVSDFLGPDVMINVQMNAASPASRHKVATQLRNLGRHALSSSDETSS